MDVMKPWHYGPHELIQHGNDHFSKGSDIDKRIAFISYDNSIEISITTYLSLVPSLRDNLEYEKEEVKKWLVNYPAKLDFFIHYLNENNLKHLYKKDEIIRLHKIRNDLYHKWRDFVPTTKNIETIKKISEWVFRTLFKMPLDISFDNLTKLKTNYKDISLRASIDPAPGEEVFLHSFFLLEKLLKEKTNGFDFKILENEFSFLPKDIRAVKRALELKNTIDKKESITMEDEGLRDVANKLDNFRKKIKGSH